MVDRVMPPGGFGKGDRALPEGVWVNYMATGMVNKGVETVPTIWERQKAWAAGRGVARRVLMKGANFTLRRGEGGVGVGAWARAWWRRCRDQPS